MDMAPEDATAAAERGDTRTGAPEPLADFGPRAWPRDRVAAYTWDAGFEDMRKLMEELA